MLQRRGHDPKKRQAATINTPWARDQGAGPKGGKGVLWCRDCGAYAMNRVALLAEPCKRQPSVADRQFLIRIQAIKKPLGFAGWPDETAVGDARPSDSD